LALEIGYLDGRVVPTNLEFQYKTLLKRSGGHGHVVVYKVNPGEVNVVDYFHSAQDWQTKVADLE
jgi:plasmid stabilization system protein ParE